MATAASRAAIASPRGKARTRAHGVGDAATAAWLCAIPCAVAVAVAIVVLGAPLGRFLAPAPGEFTFVLEERPFVRPEPTEHARYLIALSAPLLAALAIASATRWQRWIPARVAAVAAQGTQLALAGVVVAAIVAQYRLAFGAPYEGGELRPFHIVYFSPATLAVGALLAAATAAIAAHERLRGRATALLRESRISWIALAAATAVTIVWVMPGLQSDWSIAMAPADLLYHMDFPLNETFAVIDGRTPLVNFTAQYSSLWPFVAAVPMAAFGKTLLTFTITMCTIGTLALLAVYGVLRRVTRSSRAALLLYLPIVASSLFVIGGPQASRSTIGTYFGTFPLRYAGPWFVAWLTARALAHDDDPPAWSLWLLFTAAGLALINNGDFGAGAAGASVAALACTRALSRRALLRLACVAGAGLATALGLVSALTLVRAGSLPQFSRVVENARLFAVGGYALEPIPGVLGVHLLIYLTYVAAIAVAVVRALQRAPNRVLTGMLTWAGIFGLGAGAYYVGRSHPVALKHQFGAWSFALGLLTVVAVQAMASEQRRRAAIGAAVALFGFGVLTCSLAQTPLPWIQLDRLSAPYVTIEPEWRSPNLLVPPRDPAARAFVASIADGPDRFVLRQGAPVEILLTLGHRVADAYGVVNVSPYTGIESLQTVQRVEAALDALRDAGGNTVILPTVLDESILRLLERRGFEVLTPSGLRRYVPGRVHPTLQPWPIVDSVTKWVDTRNLYPRALR